MSDSHDTKRHGARPFIPQRLEESDSAYRANDIFAGGLTESAGGYIANKKEERTDIIPTLDETQLPASPSEETPDTEDATAASPSPTHEIDEDALKKESYDSGYQDGLKKADEMLDAYKKDTAHATAALHTTLQDAISHISACQRSLEDDAIRAFLTIYKRVFDAAVKQPKTRAKLLHSILSEELSSVADRIPSGVMIQTHPDDSEFFRQLWEFSPLTGDAVTFEESQRLAPGDITLHWQDGQMRVTPEHLYTYIEESLKNTLSTQRASADTESD